MSKHATTRAEAADAAGGYGAPADAEVVHGGNLDEARAMYQGAPEPWIDLSTGINPVPYPLPDIAQEAWTRLPTRTDLDCLRLAAARRYGVGDAGELVAAPGTQALIQILPRLIAPTRVAVIGPTYEEHARSWARQGHAVAGIATPEAADAPVVVIVNPNNPTGRLVAPAQIRRLAERCATAGGMLVVDEAFMDAMADDVAVAPFRLPATVVLRSFGKMYGLAGLRLGFAIAPPAIAAALSAGLGPWAVPGPAITVGAHALGDDAWLAEARARLSRDAERLDGILESAGLSIVGGTPLFRLAASNRATEIAGRLGRHGIHVRRFPAEPSWLRFGLPGGDAAWTRLAAALAGA